MADDIIILDEGCILAQGDLAALRAGSIDVARYISSRKPTNSSSGGQKEVLEFVEPIEIGQHPPLPQADELALEGASDEKVETVPEVDDEQMGVLGSAGWTPYKFFFQCCGWSSLAAAAISIACYSTVEVGLQVGSLCYSTAFKR